MDSLFQAPFTDASLCFRGEVGKAHKQTTCQVVTVAATQEKKAR